jgi:hypothetical protein
MNSPSAEVTAVLRAIRNGDREAIDHLFHALYGELRRNAQGQRRQWQGDETLNTTALVHEAYLKLVGNEPAEWQDRAHFCAVAATACARRRSWLIRATPPALSGMMSASSRSGAIVTPG